MELVVERMKRLAANIEHDNRTANLKKRQVSEKRSQLLHKRGRRDITERKGIEEKVEVERRRLFSLLDELPAVILLCA